MRLIVDGNRDLSGIFSRLIDRVDSDTSLLSIVLRVDVETTIIGREVRVSIMEFRYVLVNSGTVSLLNLELCHSIASVHCRLLFTKRKNEESEFSLALSISLHHRSGVHSLNFN